MVDAVGSDEEVNELEDSHAWYCPDCEAQFYADEEGWEQDECFDCGETNCYEIPG